MVAASFYGVLRHIPVFCFMQIEVGGHLDWSDRKRMDVKLGKLGWLAGLGFHIYSRISIYWSIDRYLDCPRLVISG